MSGAASCAVGCYDPPVPCALALGSWSNSRISALSLVIRAGLLTLLVGASACSATPPAQFKQGGAPLALARARWERGDDHVVDLMPDGRVLFDGVERYHVDVAGRVYDKDKDPVALLMPDGVLVGNEEAPLGIVGTQTASPPGATTAWLLLSPNGRFVAFDQEGQALDAGAWKGCEGPVARTCLLVGHVTRLAARQQSSGPMIGFGVGVGVGGFRR